MRTSKEHSTISGTRPSLMRWRAFRPVTSSRSASSAPRPRPAPDRRGTRTREAPPRPDGRPGSDGLGRDGDGRPPAAALPAIVRRSGVLAFWRSGVLAFWRSGVLAFWRSGANCNAGLRRRCQVHYGHAVAQVSPLRGRTEHRLTGVRQSPGGGVGILAPRTREGAPPAAGAACPCSSPKVIAPPSESDTHAPSTERARSPVPAAVAIITKNPP